MEQIWCLGDDAGWASTGRQQPNRNIHFICCSNETSALEMAEPTVKDLLRLEADGIITYDAHLQQDVLVVAPVLCALCDSSHAYELL